MRVVGTLFCVIAFFMNSFSQTDSLRKIVRQRYLKVQVFDSVLCDLKKNGVRNIITYVGFNDFGYNGVILWQNGISLKAIELTFLDKKFRSKKLKIPKSNTVLLDSLFFYPCEMIWKISEGKKAKVGEDLIIYFQRNIDTVSQETYFTYSRYLLAEEFLCMSGLKRLISGF